MSISTTTKQNPVIIEGKPTKLRYLLVATLFIGIFIAYIDRVNVSVLGANSTFLNDMGIAGQTVKIGMMMSTFLMAYGICNAFLSPLGDYLGPRKTMMICIVLWTVAQVIGGVAGIFAMIIVSRVILGIGEGTYYPLQFTFIKNWIPPQERGRANAVWVIGQSVSPVVAMPFYTYIMASLGWRESFFISAALSIIPLYMLWAYTTDTPRSHKKISALELKYIEEGLAGEGTVEETTTKIPLWERLKEFILTHKYWLAVISNICLQFVYWGLVTWIPSFLKMARGFSWVQMGWLSSLPFVFGIIFKAMSGCICDRMRRSGPVIAIAFLLSGVALYFGTTIYNNYAAAILVALAVGFTGLITPAQWTLMQNMVPQKSISVASGIMMGLGMGISSLSPAFVGYLISLTGKYATGLVCLIAFCILGVMSATILSLKKY